MKEEVKKEKYLSKREELLNAVQFAEAQAAA